jgi:hypothetical protein
MSYFVLNYNHEMFKLNVKFILLQPEKYQMNLVLFVMTMEIY